MSSSKKEHWLRERFANPQWDVKTTRNVERQMRKSRKYWKKARNKYLRQEGKKETDEE